MNKTCIGQKIFAFLFSASLIFGTILGSYWYWFDKPSTTIIYTHPYFLKHPVFDRNEIIPENEIKTANHGDVVYHYIEYCVDDKRTGDMIEKYASVKSNGGVVTINKKIPTLSEEGCFKRSFIREIPKNLPEGDYTFQIIIRKQLNPIIGHIDVVSGLVLVRVEKTN